MRKIFLFLFFACFAQAQQAAQQAKPAAQAAPAQAKPALGWCRLGTDPVDAARKPDLGSECVVKSPAMPVTMMTGSGRSVRCLLPPLTPIVVDRQTGVAKWVLACGNPIVSPANWVPSGLKICGPEPSTQPTVADVPAPPPAAPAEMRVSGEVRVVHEGEVRLVHSGEIRHVHEPQPAPEPTPAPTPQPKKGWWSRNWKIIVPVAIGAGAGAAVALTRGGQKTIQYQPLPPPLYRP
jgi:hypothetical protein